MIRIEGSEESINFGDIYSYGIPTGREIVIENICDKDIFVEPKFTSSSLGIELRIEKENPNCSILDYNFSQCPVFRYARRPNELYSQLYEVERLDLKKGEKKRLLLILTVTPEFLKVENSKEMRNMSIFSDSDEESDQDTTISILSGECHLSFHCFTALPCHDSSDLAVPIRFSTCMSSITSSNKRLYLNDLHVGMLYDREIVVSNLSPFPSAFSVQTIQNSSYVCSVFMESETDYKLLSDPVILHGKEKKKIIIRIQPLQTGYHEIPIRIINETNFLDIVELTILTLTTKAIKQQDVFFSMAPGRPLTTKGLLFDFGGCFEGRSVMRELFITNNSEYDVTVKPKSNRGNMVVFTAKVNTEETVVCKEDEREIAGEFSVENSDPVEKPVMEVRVLSHSSYRICVYYTPEGDPNSSDWLHLHHDIFYLLFELRSPREYGEISLFCHVSYCGCEVDAASQIFFGRCHSDECYTREWVITNKSSLPVHLVLACGASSLTYPSDLLTALPSSELLRVQQLLHRPIPEIAYSLVIPEKGAVSIPVEYRAKTHKNHYANYIDLINLDAEPIQVLRCDILADIQQPPDSLQNAISLLDPITKEPIDKLLLGQVVSGGTSAQGVCVQNEKPCPISMSISCPSCLYTCWLDNTIDYTFTIAIESDSDDKQKKIMDSLNLDTLANTEDGVYDSPTVTSPVTLSESLSPSYLHGYSGNETSESSDMLPIHRSSSIDIRNSLHRIRSQSQVDISPSFGRQSEGENSNDFGQKEQGLVKLDLKDVNTIIRWINGTMESELSLEKQRKVRMSILNRLKDLSQNQHDPLSLPESGLVLMYVLFSPTEEIPLSPQELELEFSCHHLPSSPPSFVFSNSRFSASTSPVRVRELPTSTSSFLFGNEIECEEGIGMNESVSLPIVKRALTEHQQNLTPPHVSTGSQSVHESMIDAESWIMKCLCMCERIDCVMSTPQTHLHFGKLYTKKRYEKLIHIRNECCIAIPLLIQQSINYNLAVEKDQQELLLQPHGTGVMRVVLEPSVPGEFTGTIRLYNLLNGTKSLTFIVKAFVSQEITFAILSEIPINLDVFAINTKTKGILKIQNTATRDLQYLIECESCFCSYEGHKCDGLDCLVEIRRTSRSANGLNSNEREHLESSKEKLLRDIRVCKRKGRRRAQEALERRLENIVKRLNEDKGLNSDDSIINTTALFEEVRSLRVLLEPDYSIVLFVNILIRVRPGFMPAVPSFQLEGSIAVTRSTSTISVPIIGTVTNPYYQIPLIPSISVKPFSVPFSVTVDSTIIRSTSSPIPSIIVEDNPGSTLKFLVIKNEIFDSILVDVHWDNAYQISPDFGSIFFTYQEIEGNQNMDVFLHSINTDNNRNRKKQLLNLKLPPQSSLVLHYKWKTTNHSKRLSQPQTFTPLGFISIMCHRQRTMIMNLPLLLKPIVSGLSITPSDINLGEFNFGRLFNLKLTLQNSTNESLIVCSQASCLMNQTLEETLRPHEKRDVRVDLRLSARALHEDGSVQEALNFVCPEKPTNICTCMIRAIVKNPLFLTLPDIDPENIGHPGLLVLNPALFLSMTENNAFSYTSIRVRNLRDIDIYVSIDEATGMNPVVLVDEMQKPVERVVVPQESEAILQLQYSVENRVFQISENQLATFTRLLSGKLRISGSCQKSDQLLMRSLHPSYSDLAALENVEAAPDESKENNQEFQNLFSFCVDYSIQAGLVRFELGERMIVLVNRTRASSGLNSEFKIQNENTAMKLPYTISVDKLSSPEIGVSFNRMEGIVDEGKYHYISFHVSTIITGYSSFSIIVSHRDVNVTREISVHVFNCNNSLEIATHTFSFDSVDWNQTAELDLGRIAVYKPNPESPRYFVNPRVKTTFSLFLRNTSGVAMCVIPYSNLPLILHIGDGTEDTGGHSPGCSHHNSGSYSSISSFPSLMMDEKASIPTNLQNEMGLLPISAGIMLFPDKEVEIRIGMKADEMIDMKSGLTLDADSSNGNVDLTGQLCFFNSRGDNYFQQIVSLRGSYYREKIEVSCPVTNKRVIFANSSRYPRLDLRIDNLSSGPVMVDLSWFPSGFIPTVYYSFSRSHSNQEPTTRRMLKNGRESLIPIEEGCLVTLVLELHMKVVKWAEGVNRWPIVFSTQNSPGVYYEVVYEATVFKSALTIEDENQNDINTIHWNNVPFPSLSECITEVSLHNITSSPIHVIPLFRQFLYQQAVTIAVDQDISTLEIAANSRISLRLSLHPISIHSLGKQQITSMQSPSVVGQLQLLVDVSESHSDTLRTIVEIPVSIVFTMQPIIEVSPAVLNIVTILEHFSKLEDILQNHYDVNSCANPIVGESAVGSPKNEVESGIVNNRENSSPTSDTSHSLQQRELTQQLLDSEKKKSFMICRLDKNNYDFVIHNIWKERVQVSIVASHIIHRKYGLLYPGQTNYVFASLLEVPKVIVIEPETSIKVQCILRPDYRYNRDYDNINDSFSCITLRTLVFDDFPVILPLAIQSSVHRPSVFDESSLSLTTSLSLSVILKGVSAVVDGNVIVVDGEKVLVNEEKNVEILISGRNQEDIQIVCNVSDCVPFISLVSTNSNSLLFRLKSQAVGFFSALIVIQDIKIRDFCFVNISVTFICNPLQVMSLPSIDMEPFAISADLLENIGNFHGKPSIPMPVIISTLQRSGKWEAVDLTSVLELEGVSFGSDRFIESHVIGATNLGNVELTMALFHSKFRGHISFFECESNQQMKILTLPPHTTKYFTVVINAWDSIDDSASLNEMISDSENLDNYGSLNTYDPRSVPFKFYFSNLVKCSISVCFVLKRMAESFSIRDEKQVDLNDRVLDLFIQEDETGHFSVANSPSIRIRNLSEETGSILLMLTSSYVCLAVQNQNDMSGRILTIAPGNEVICGFQIIVETFLDRMRHGQTLYDKQILLFKNVHTKEIKRVILRVTNSTSIDRFQSFSLISAAETIFRRCLTIASKFIQIWLDFPRELTPTNVIEIKRILENPNEFEFDTSVLSEGYQELMCIMSLVIEVLRSKPELKHFITNAVSFLELIYRHTVFTVFIESHVTYPPCLEQWVLLLYDLIAACPVLYPHVKNLLFDTMQSVQ